MENQYLLGLAKNKEKLQKEIELTAGLVLKEMEKAEIFPEKDILLAINNAMVFPFLFKHYAIEQAELDFVKTKVRSYQLNKNLNDVLSNPNKKSDDLTPEVISFETEQEKDFKGFVAQKEDKDLSNYEVLLETLKNGSFVEYLPKSHNTKTLERVLNDGFEFEILDTDEGHDNFNVMSSWILNILFDASNEELDRLSPKLIQTINWIIAEASFDGNHQVRRIFNSSKYYEKLHSPGYKYTTFSDLEKLLGLPDDKFEDVFRNAWNNELNDNTKSASDDFLFCELSYIVASEIKNNRNLDKFKEITGNKIVNLWDVSDFKENKDLFFKEAILKTSGASLHFLEHFSKALPDGFEMALDESDYEKVLGKFLKDKRETNYYEIVNKEYSKNEMLLIAKLISLGMSEDNKDLQMFLMKTFESQNNRGVSTSEREYLSQVFYKALGDGVFNNSRNFAPLMIKILENADFHFKIRSQKNLFENIAKNPVSFNKVISLLQIDKRQNFLPENLLEDNVSKLSDVEVSILREAGFLEKFPNVVGIKGADFYGNIKDSFLNDISSWNYANGSQDVLKSKTLISFWKAIEFKIDERNIETFVDYALRNLNETHLIEFIKMNFDKNPNLKNNFSQKDLIAIELNILNDESSKILPDVKLLTSDLKELLRLETLIDEMKNTLQTDDPNLVKYENKRTDLKQRYAVYEGEDFIQVVANFLKINKEYDLVGKLTNLISNEKVFSAVLKADGLTPDTLDTILSVCANNNDFNAFDPFDYKLFIKEDKLSPWSLDVAMALMDNYGYKNGIFLLDLSKYITEDLHGHLVNRLKEDRFAKIRLIPACLNLLANKCTPKVQANLILSAVDVSYANLSFELSEFNQIFKYRNNGVETKNIDTFADLDNKKISSSTVDILKEKTNNWVSKVILENALNVNVEQSLISPNQVEKLLSVQAKRNEKYLECLMEKKSSEEYEAFIESCFNGNTLIFPEIYDVDYISNQDDDGLKIINSCSHINPSFDFPSIKDSNGNNLRGSIDFKSVYKISNMKKIFNEAIKNDDPMIAIAAFINSGQSLDVFDSKVKLTSDNLFKFIKNLNDEDVGEKYINMAGFTSRTTILILAKRLIDNTLMSDDPENKEVKKDLVDAIHSVAFSIKHLSESVEKTNFAKVAISEETMNKISIIQIKENVDNVFSNMTFLTEDEDSANAFKI